MTGIKKERALAENAEKKRKVYKKKIETQRSQRKRVKNNIIILNTNIDGVTDTSGTSAK